MANVIEKWGNYKGYPIFKYNGNRSALIKYSEDNPGQVFYLVNSGDLIMEGVVIGFATTDGTVKDWQPEIAKQRKRDFVDKVKAAKEQVKAAKEVVEDNTVDIDKILNDAFKKSIEDYLK